MIVDQIPHSPKGKILHQLVCKEIMGEAQFDAADVMQLLQVFFLKCKFHAGHIVFKLG